MTSLAAQGLKKRYKSREVVKDVSFEVANFLLSNPGDQGRDMGDFTLTATTSGNPVPEPATMGIASGLACIAIAFGFFVVANLDLLTVIIRHFFAN